MNLVYAFIGCLFGTLVGVLPGIGPLATLAMLLPATFVLPPSSALIMLAGIYYGAQYGGSTTSILVNLPGEVSSVVTCIDGHQMARQGRGGPALTVAALGSFFAGCVGTLVLASLALPMSKLALSFGPAEYSSLLCLGLICAIVLSSGSLLKSLAVVIVGLLLGLVGGDVNSGAFRFTFGFLELRDGIGFIPIAMGLFGFGEIIKNLEITEDEREQTAIKVQKFMPTKQDFKDVIPAVLRGTGLGCLLGILPGGGAMLSSFAAYGIEKKIKGRPDEVPFGKGNIRGVASPESANNSAAQCAFIPMLTLGIPPSGVMALMMGAMIIHDIQPGPKVMINNPDVFWGLIASMWIGNLMLVVLNLPLIGIWIKLLKLKYRYLYPAIIMFCSIGVFTVDNTAFDIWLVAVFGLFGYVFIKLGCDPAPMLLGVILGPMLEENFRRTLLISYGDWSVFVTRPLSASILMLTLLILAMMVFPSIKKKREAVFKD
jgi:TctA family transporter